MTDFGSYIRSFREMHAMSLSEAAEIIGCSKVHIWELEQGRATNPTIKTLAGIACAYDADLGEIATMAAACCPGTDYYSVPGGKVVPFSASGGGNG